MDAPDIPQIGMAIGRGALEYASIRELIPSDGKHRKPRRSEPDPLGNTLLPESFHIRHISKRQQLFLPF